MPQRATRRRGRTGGTAAAPPPRPVQHHHLLVRAETVRAPASKAEEHTLERRVDALVAAIDMAPLGPPHAFFVPSPPPLSGMSVLQPIHTSHVAMHAWNEPQRDILHSPAARRLIQLDVYTCAALSRADIATVLAFLAPYGPTRADVTLLNRKWALQVDSHDQWAADAPGAPAWGEWVRRRFAAGG
jgi:S-adenosylmethionine/arginine decarboxylase-like enzyme